MNKPWTVFFWFAVFAFNFLLKIIRIDSSPLSYDEIISVKDTLLDFGHIKHESEWDTNPPFYYYLLWFWTKLFGISEFSVRALSALFNAATCVVIGRFLYRLAGFHLSIVFIVLFTIHPALLYYAQEARCYSLLLFIGSLSLVSFYNFLIDSNWKNVFLLGLLNFLLIYTHYLSFLIPLTQLVFVLWFKRDLFVRLSFSYLIVLILIGLRFTKRQFLLIFGVSSDSIKETWIKKATIADLGSFYEFAYTYIVVYLLVMVLSFFLIRKGVINTEKFKDVILYSLLISLLAPLILFVLGIKIPIFINRYILFSIVFSLIVYSFVVVYLKKWGWGLFILIAFVEISKMKFGESRGMDFRSVAGFVKTIEGKPKVIIYKKDVTELFAYYYDREIFKAVKFNDKSVLNTKNIYDANNLEDFRQIDLKNDKVIMLFQTFDNSKTNPDIYGYFSEMGFKVSKFSVFDGVRFILFTRL